MPRINKYLLSYIFIRIIIFPLSYFPYRMIHFLGKILGLLCYYMLRHFRKRTLSNLALASKLNLTPRQIRYFAKKSFQNLATVILEYPRFSKENHFEKIIICENPEIAQNLYQKKQGIVFFCGHQANWEALLLDGSTRMKGIAIGKSIKNPYLYRWIVNIRERTKGKMILPQKALREGLKNLKNGNFIGIVGDQGMPESSL